MIVASFTGCDDLHAALNALRAAAVEAEIYTPAPIAQTGANGTAPVLPLLILCAFLFGSGTMFGLQIYADTVAYPMNIGGRPDNSWPAFIVNAFEVGVLCAMLIGVAGYFAINRMPRFYDPIDQVDIARRASRDLWLLAVHDAEPARIRALLAPHRSVTIELIA